VGGGFPREAAGCRRRVLLCRQPHQPRIRGRCPPRERRPAGRVAEEHRRHRPRPSPPWRSAPSSPRFQQAFPVAAADYRARAQRGWQFLTDAIARYGIAGAYQKIQHFGDAFTTATTGLAACEMFLATGDLQYQTALKSWFPTRPAGATGAGAGSRCMFCYGNAAAIMRSREERPADGGQLDSDYYNACVSAVITGGDTSLGWSRANAYGSSFPDATKRVRSAGWYFSTSSVRPRGRAAVQPNAGYMDAFSVT